YQISSGSLCWMSLNRSSFTRVIWRGVPRDALTIARSPIVVCVDTVAASVAASRDALKATTSRAPSVIDSIAPVAIDTRLRFELPFSADTTISDEPSADQTIGLRFCPRGAD